MLKSLFDGEEKTMGKEIIVSPFVRIFDIISLFAVELEKLNIGIPAKGLNQLFLTLIPLISFTYKLLYPLKSKSPCRSHKLSFILVYIHFAFRQILDSVVGKDLVLHIPKII